jgi:hypothetical protein
VAVGIELDDHVRTFVGYPDIVSVVDLYEVGIGPGVHIVAKGRQPWL